MDFAEYKLAVKGVRASKRLGQSFLMDIGVAKAEAEYARGRVVIEFGAGMGVLTNELCAVAKKVIAVEYDRRLFEILEQRLRNGNLTLLNGDFFELDEKNFGSAEIMVSNIPYNLSSRVLMWLGEKSMPAVLCLQKEFVERMLAKAGTREYSRLSVVSKLRFQVHRLMSVGPERFYPRPKVDSEVVYVKPIGKSLDGDTSSTISLLMMHKKKKLRNAIIDSAGALGLEKSDAAEIADSMSDRDSRVFQMEPEAILDAAKRVNRLVRNQKE